MKRLGNLWESLISFENLLHAARDSARRKRFKPAIAAFHFGLERELWTLHRELAGGSYQPGPYTEFYIHEPKKRLISASPYRDRVVHHAVTRILSPIFERSFIFDSYACRVGKGTHAAVDRAQEYAHRFPYVLKADVRKFFPSVDHEILIDRISRKIKDPHILDLSGDRRHSLPRVSCVPYASACREGECTTVSAPCQENAKTVRGRANRLERY
jgi:RNA-directed DNA polymerase